jgi:cytochrome c oxidase subunit 2
MMPIHRLVKIGFCFGISMLMIFLSVIVVRAFYLGSQPPNCILQVNPERIEQTAPFNNPGLHKVYGKDWDYELIVVASAFSYNPKTVQVPLGAKLKIIATSNDVIHSLNGKEANIHMMLEPGYVKEDTATFHKIGEYLLLCSSYCGSGHKLMISKIKVVNNEI